jgi:multicomponent Na+:H+ antiporter subunit A
MALPIAILSLFLLAFLAPLVCRASGRASGWLLSLLPVSLALIFSTFVTTVNDGNFIISAHRWVPSLHVQFSFYLDGLSLLFSLLITVIGAVVLVYAGAYLHGDPRLGRFFFWILIFMGSMLGIVLADSLILLFVFWELTSLSSYFLIGFDDHEESARASALQALLATGAGGLAMLAGLILLGNVAETSELSALTAQADRIKEHDLYLTILVLILIGAFTKSAQFPFHFWLPNAMAAPAPVSAYLHSATMVKAGVYLLARLSPVLSGTEAWSSIVPLAGMVTMVIAAILALQETDLKRILAYSTLSALGVLVMLLGLGTPGAAKAAVAFLFAHALYKGALFLIAGAIDHETGTREVDRLGGLRRKMPLSAAAALLAAASMAGLPPFFGFIAKEGFYEAVFHAEFAAALLTALAMLASAIFVALAFGVGVLPFIGSLKSMPKSAHEAPLAMWSGPLCLAAAALIAGLLPRLAAEPLLAPATATVLNQPMKLDLSLWHGWNAVLLLSIVTSLGGLGMAALRLPIRHGLLRLKLGTKFGPEKIYEFFLYGLNALARRQTQVLQNGYLRIYLLVVIVATLAAAGGPLLGIAAFSAVPDIGNFRFYELGLALLIVVAALAATFSLSRLGAIAALGVVGYGIALLYILFGAPDLAMTQFLIETLLVMLFVLVFYYLPRFATFSNAPTRLRDGLVAIAAGALMTVLVLTVTRVQLHPSIAEYFIENSVPLAHGRNIVNVIIVDFRALDTLGEITVLAVAGIGVFGLLKLRRRKEQPS